MNVKEILSKMESFNLQFGVDKAGHFIFGQVIYTVVRSVAPRYVALAAVIVVMVGKEAIGKYYKGKPFSIADILYGVAGAITLYR